MSQLFNGNGGSRMDEEDVLPPGWEMQVRQERDKGEIILND